MESAKKKEILNSYLEASKEWRYWKDETERLMVAATGASPSLSGMPHGGSTGTSKVELAAESLEDARRELAAALSDGWQLAPQIAEQQGMFSLLPLKEADVLSLRKEHGIYMPTSGRINIAGLKSEDIPRVARVLKPLLG